LIIEFLRFLQFEEQYRQELINAAQEAQRIQKELDQSLQSMADLETKLFHARRLLETETKARRAAEYERDQMVKFKAKQIIIVIFQLMFIGKENSCCCGHATK